MNSPSSEYSLLEDLKSILTEHSDFYEIEIGDDAAVRKGNETSQLIFTTDLSVENVHFRLDWMSFREIGYKSMVTNLSDCASMGAVPESALIQLTFPAGTPYCKENIRELYRGFNDACSKWHFPIIGGDLSCGSQWAIGITLIGKVPCGMRTLKRTGAVSGDRLWVSGVPGKSSVGLRLLNKFGRNNIPAKYNSFVDAHIVPEPRIDLGLELRDNPHVHAMMDLSDGLAKDGRTLAFENNLGITLEIDSSHISALMIESGMELDISPMDCIIQGGEEYELLFAASPEFQPAQLQPKSGKTCICIGTFSDSISGLWIRKESGIDEILYNGWNHI